METVDCVSESYEEQPASSNVTLKESDTIGEAGNYTCKDAIIHTNTAAADDKSINDVIDTHTESEVGTNTESTIDRNTESTIGTNSDAAIDTNTDAAFSGRTGAAIDIVNSNVDATMHGSTNVGNISGIFGSGSTESAVDAGATKNDISVNANLSAAIEMITDPVINSSCDAALNANTNIASIENSMISKEEEALNELKHVSSKDHEMVTKSGETAHNSNSEALNDNDDSEVEIIECTSESLEGQPATRSTNVNNQCPEFTIDASGDASRDINTEVAVKPSTRGDLNVHIKNARRGKKDLYNIRCKNLRLYKKRQSNDTEQPQKTKTRVNHCLDKLTKNNMKFMENFDPKRSNRERRKLLRKANTRSEKKRDLYGLNGTLLLSGKNLCDCMDSHCPGCHFPCPRCHSPKCGHECRVNRKWTYEEIEIDGTEIVIKPHELIQSFCNKR